MHLLELLRRLSDEGVGARDELEQENAEGEEVGLSRVLLLLEAVGVHGKRRASTGGSHLARHDLLSHPEVRQFDSKIAVIEVQRSEKLEKLSFLSRVAQVLREVQHDV